MQTQQPLSVSDLVRADYRLADVFKKWGINYCCGGNLALADVCQLQGLDQPQLEAEMQQAQQTIVLSNALAFTEWPVDFLVEYLVHVHHAYLKTQAPKLLLQFESFARGHEKKYPYLTAVYEHFKKLVAVATEQALQEEAVTFPYIKQVANALKRRESYGPLFMRTMRQSLASTHTEAQQQLLLLRNNLRNATHNYNFPDGACTNHQVIYHKLKEFDADLVQHKHLENNILFPKVMQMEQELLQL